MLFKYMIDKCEIDHENDGLDVNFISRLIHGKPLTQVDQGREWMFEIVANKRNSFDVDKLDYLCRDNYHCGLNQQQGHQDYINFETIIKSSRVVENQIAYNIKIVNSIKMVYDLRFEMFRAIYNHKTAQAIDLMYQDVLVKADPVFDFLDNLNNPQKYVNYTDLIIQRIAKSKDSRLKDSQDIIDRIKKRQLYQHADSCFLQDYSIKDEFNVQDIVDLSDGALKADDIILLPTKYDYGCGTAYPIDKMTFYINDLNLKILEQVNDFEYGLSKPQRNQEPYMRIFVRDASKQQEAMRAFRRFCKKINPEKIISDKKNNKREANNKHKGEINDYVDNLQNIHYDQRSVGNEFQSPSQQAEDGTP